jgi:hypothetical protein
VRRAYKELLALKECRVLSVLRELKVYKAQSVLQEHKAFKGL